MNCTVTLSKIQSDGIDLEKAQALYLTSFPESERRDAKKWKDMVLASTSTLFALYKIYGWRFCRHSQLLGFRIIPLHWAFCHQQPAERTWLGQRNFIGISDSFPTKAHCIGSRSPYRRNGYPENTVLPAERIPCLWQPIYAATLPSGREMAWAQSIVHISRFCIKAVWNN